MKVLLATGNHPRHQYLVRLFKENGFLDALIMEERENFSPVTPEGLDARTGQFFTTHFRKREEAENFVFGSRISEFENSLRIAPGEINSVDSLEFLMKNKPDVVITAGIGILGNEFLKLAPKETWNLHGGLSPWYKGAITHFWPSYQLEPQFTGCTLHYISSKIDAGAIIHQTPAVLKEGDGLQELSSRSLKLGFDEIITVLQILKKQRSVKSVKQASTGKLWLKRDWKPQHLNLIYGLYQDRVVDSYLEGKIERNTPALVQQGNLI